MPTGIYERSLEHRKKISDKLKISNPAKLLSSKLKLKENHTGINNAIWKGGRKQTYHIRARKVMEEYLGRRLSKKEIVHHIDFDNKNNSILNLHLFSSQKEHKQYHKFLRDIVKEFIAKEIFGERLIE